MEQAKSLEDLIKRIAEELTMCDHVYYDLDSLKYGVMFDDWLAEYYDYLELSDHQFNEIPEDVLGGRQREEADDIRKTLELPQCIDKPSSSVAFGWMEEFTDAHANDSKFFHKAALALRNRHPFQGFKSVLYWSGLTDKWYPFRDAKMEEYVRKNL